MTQASAATQRARRADATLDRPGIRRLADTPPLRYPCAGTTKHGGPCPWPAESAVNRDRTGFAVIVHTDLCHHHHVQPEHARSYPLPNHKPTGGCCPR